METAIFGGGCFWCTEAIFGQLKGVISVMPGYSGGVAPNPTYESVCSGTTGHAEVIKIDFDPEVVSFKDLLKVFFSTHDPTTINRQGSDTGTQYRSVIFYTNNSQRIEAEKFITDLTTSGIVVVTEIAPFQKFYPAEDYHKKYYENHLDQAYCQIVINPKLEKLQEKFSNFLKK